MNLKKISTALAVLVAAAQFAGTAQAAAIDWNTPATIANDSDVVALGAAVYAYTESNASATLNGVSFTAGNSYTSLGSGKITMTGFTATSTTAFSAPAGISAGYTNLTKGATYGNTAAATVTLRSLTENHVYIPQIWVNDSRIDGKDRTEIVSGENSNPVTLDYNNTEAAKGKGQYTVGRFTANSTNQTFTLTGNASCQLNAIQLRDISNLGAWTGTGGATWDDAMTLNFADNLYSAALNAVTFTAAKTPLGSVTFGDVYWDSSAATAVTTTNVVVAAAGVSGGTVYFDSVAANYTVSNAGGTTGIGGTTKLIKAGTSTLVLEGTNSYSGGTRIVDGTLKIASSAAGGVYNIAGPNAILNFGTNAVFNQTAATTINGIGTFKLDSPIIFGTAQNINTALSAGGRIWVTGNVLVTGSSNSKGVWSSNLGSLQVDEGSEINFVEAGNATAISSAQFDALNGGGTIKMGYSSYTKTLIGGAANGSGAFSGKISDRIEGSTQRLSFEKRGTGTQTLSGTNSTYTGVTIFTGGILNVAKLSTYGVAGSLGARTSTLEKATDIGLLFRSGTLQYTGTEPQSTDRQIRISTTGGTIDASGTTPEATVSFTYTGANTDLFENPGTRTLTLTGSNSGANTFAIKLENQSANATSLTKTGSGTWVLSGTNTHSGTTSVSAGTLRIVNNAALGSTSGLTTITGGTATSVLELANDITVTGATLRLDARQGAGENAPHLRNYAGTNTWAGPVTTDLGGATYNLEAAAGSLLISGNVSIGKSSIRILQLMGAAEGEISGVISGAAGNNAQVVKKDAGTWTLSGANTYTGLTSVVAGTLRLATDNAITNVCPVTVAAAGTLDLTDAAQSVARLTVSSGATMRTTVAADGSCGTLSVPGNLSVNGLNITVNNPANLKASKAYTVLQTTGGTITGIPQTDLPEPWLLEIRENGTALQISMPAGSLLGIY